MAKPAPPRRPSTPQHVLSLVPADLTRSDSGAIVATTAWVASSRRRGDQWSDPGDPARYDAGSLWLHIESLVRANGRLIVIAPNGADALTLTRFWDALTAGRFWLSDATRPAGVPARSYDRKKGPWRGAMVLSARTCLVTVRCRSGSVTIVGMRQYQEIEAIDLVRTFAPEHEPHHETEASDPADLVYPQSHCLAILRWYTRSIEIWASRGGGAWQHTAARLSHTLFRTLTGSAVARSHKCQEVAELERYACYGGRQSVWFTGPVGDPSAAKEGTFAPPSDDGVRLRGTRVHHLDVASMYPHILATMKFPGYLKSVRTDIRLGDLADYCRYHGVIATVRLNASTQEYPTRSKSGTIFPVGEFTTVLAGPELEQACVRGDITHVFSVCRYELGRTYKSWGNTLLRWRRDARRQGDAVQESLAKTIANAFGGTFAARPVRWADAPKIVAPIEWGEWITRGVGGAPPTHYRAIAGRTQVRVYDSRPPRLPVAVYAYLTAYGRTMMRLIRERMPEHSVISQDTDGIWVTDAGYHWALGRYDLTSRVPGKLRHVRSVDYARFYSARCYYAGDRWTVAGLAAVHRIRDDGSAVGTYTVNPAVFGHSDACGGLRTLESAISLRTLCPQFREGLDGWHDPIVKLAPYQPEVPPHVETDPLIWLRDRRIPS